MSDKMYDELALERSVRERFGVDIDIMQVIVSHAPVSHTSEATLFLTTKKQLYVYVTGQSKLLLGDVKKIVTRMGLKADSFIPPMGQPNYFDDIGRIKFKEVYPGRSNPSSDDLIFYRTLAPYSPALALISEVKYGEVYQFDTDSASGKRVAVRFAYRRIVTK